MLKIGIYTQCNQLLGFICDIVIKNILCHDIEYAATHGTYFKQLVS